jgi:amino acid adenylation domain-containing protein
MNRSSAGADKGDTVGARLARAARRAPGRTAIIERGVGTTFGALDNVATRVAVALRRAAGARQGRVCLHFESKRAAVAALFGAARAGLPYVLLDAADPLERLRFIARDSEPVALLTERVLLERARAIVPDGCAVVEMETAEGGDGELALAAVAPDAPLYLCYTSGSTGKPKGVVQTHRNLLFFADAYARALRLGDDDRHSLVYTLSFNAANMDIYGGMLWGATLCAYDMRGEGLPHLPDWLDRERITVLHAVPTVFREALSRLPSERVLPHLRVVDLGGEAVFGSDVELFRRHTLPSCVLVNQIASTEVGLIAQQVVTHQTSHAPEALVPAGRCPEGVRVEMLRDDGSRAGIGEPGEMVVCSAHVSPGYWRRPELDAAAFSTDPLDARMRRYRSGDLGRIDADGNLHFLGRRGSRVKIHGHSVDLMEVEAAIAACSGVDKVAVLAPPGGSDTVRLVAFVVPHAGVEPEASRLRRELATRAPAYMRPRDIVFLDALPLTSSGKIDRTALASLPLEAPMAARDAASPDDEVERAIADVFAELLGIQPVGRDDDFFLLGGDSLRGAELHLRLAERFGVHVASLHEDATVAHVAAAVRAAQARPFESRTMPVLVPLWQQGDAVPLFLVHGRHGQAFVSAHFMKLLGDDQPVWAFQARGLDGRDEPHGTVEDMAQDYLAALRAARPRGPYFIGALCAGAYVAAAMARALQADGEVVLPLLLLDPPESLLNGGYTDMSEERFVAKMTARRARGSSAGPVDDPGYMKRVHRAAMAFEEAIARHRPTPYGGDVYMLASRQRTDGADELRRIFTGRVERHEVGDTHAQALDPRNPAFARELLRCVRRVQQAARRARTAA